jgi:hypothetical protein
MIDFTAPYELLNEIEALQDEVLRQLDELNLRVERTLAEYGGTGMTNVEIRMSNEIRMTKSK